MDQTTFNPNEHLMKMRGKDYLEVKWRLVWFLADAGPQAGYVTVELEHDRQNGYARYAAVAWDGREGPWREITVYGQTISICGRVATGVKTETRADFHDFAEKAETGALGRALAGLGYGTQFAPDVQEGARVVDSPVEQPSAQNQRQQPQPASQHPEQPATEQQLQSIRKLCVALGREEPAPGVLTFTGAGALIRQMSKEYNARRA